METTVDDNPEPSAPPSPFVDIEENIEIHRNEPELIEDDSSVHPAPAPAPATREPSTFVKYFASIRKYYVFPVVAVALHAAEWGFFLWGLYNVNNSDMGAVAGKSIYDRVSPPLQTYWFMTVNYWPSCTDARTNTWRLVSYQFAHSGFAHIVSNTLIGTFFSAAIEITHPYAGIFVLTVYEIAVIFGALAFSYVSPYRGLVGASSGVYGIIGSIIPHLVFDITYSPWPDSRDFVSYINLVLACSVVFILLEDLISYFVAYKENVAYTAHMAGWFVGIFLGCVFSLITPNYGHINQAKKPAWKYAVAGLGAAGFIGQFIFLIYHYRTNWPPVPLHGKDMPKFHSCCGELLDIVAHNSSITMEAARNGYSCPGDKYGIIRRTNQNAGGGDFLFT
jgi:membrane associated rhomboid family serine protease